MSKGSELDDWLERNPLTPDEEERLDPRPELRLAPDILAQALGPNASTKDALERVAGEGDSKVAVLRDAGSGMTAVAVPLERYLELVTSYIKDRNLSEVTVDNRALPSAEILTALGVEQVDPQATWLYMGGDSIG